jgi:hypothetical protein
MPHLAVAVLEILVDLQHGLTLLLVVVLEKHL